MNAPPFPTNPSFGQYYGNWVWSGSRWVCTNTNGVRLVTQVFTASAPYMPSPGLISAVVECYGAGGGGGAANCLGQATLVIAAGGGGSGGYSRIVLASGLVLGGVNVTIGVGGAGGAVGGNTGGAGTATSFGAFCVANGGGGGENNDESASPASLWGRAGPAGAVGVGDVAFAGSEGFSGMVLLFPTPTPSAFQGGAGGQIFGGNTNSYVSTGGFDSGKNAQANSGAGGSGAIVNQSSTAGVPPGGAGGSGLCIVTEYCWADTVDDGCGCGPTSGQARVAITGPQGWQGGFDND
jgi:hypothetical protein